ncbi:hypothetical protein F4604DRAFT_1679347 [Suillus subluteus]|nr:hypothetical protein F4604DRAFT_1679347 [Suillus subluteus]
MPMNPNYNIIIQPSYHNLNMKTSPQAENAEPQPQAVVNEQVLLAPTSTQAQNDVKEESSDSEDFQDDDGDPVELTRAKVLSIKERAKYELRRVMLQKEGVAPTRKKRARTVKKALRVGRIVVVGHVKYKPFETRKVKEEMVSWMSNTRRLFKDYAIHNIQKNLGLHLPIEQQGAEVHHKKMLVLTLLESLDFLHKFKYDDSGTLVCYAFEADWFVDMIVDVIYLNGLHQHLNAENFDAVFGLAGAAAFNALSCFKKGVYENIDASTEQFCDPYSRIVAMMQLIQRDNAKKERLMWLCNLIIARGREILGLPYTAGAIILRISHGYKVKKNDDPFVELADRTVSQVSHGRLGNFMVDILPFLAKVPAWFPGAGFKRIAREST